MVQTICIERQQLAKRFDRDDLLRKIKRRRRDRDEYDTSFFIQCHSCSACLNLDLWD